MIDMLEIAGSLGVGCLLAVIIFLMYRRDRKCSEDQLRQDRMFMEDRMDKIINRDQESREKHTRALEELTTTLQRMNGRK